MGESPTDDPYRSAARRLYHDCGEADLYAAVNQLYGDGAFVEITIWIPIDEAEKEDARHAMKVAALAREEELRR